MGCASCGTGKNGTPSGCQNNGFCSSGGCNKLNTFDWFSRFEIPADNEHQLVEVSFKNGARKDFYANPLGGRVITGDMVVVGSDSGYDVGRITLSGELVLLQLRKKKVRDDRVFHNVLRRANERDLQKLNEGRNLEKQALVKARVISRTLGLDMKIGDVEYQGDKHKATFYYTADGRVDFRELVRQYAREFRVKIEMRQIGARQESARIGGLGSCGRELCCSSWLSDFKSVTTSAARYQNLAINQSKLSGQCGRLKCCLNYELDAYVDALDKFPEKATELHTQAGKAYLVKMDIFKELMYYAQDSRTGRTVIYPLRIEDVHKIQEMNRNGEKPIDLKSEQTYVNYAEQVEEIDIENVGDVIELPDEVRKKSRSRNKRRKGGRNTQSKRNNDQRSKARKRDVSNNKDDKKRDAGGPDATNTKSKSRDNKGRRPTRAKRQTSGQEVSKDKTRRANPKKRNQKKTDQNSGNAKAKDKGASNTNNPTNKMANKGRKNIQKPKVSKKDTQKKTNKEQGDKK